MISSLSCLGDSVTQNYSDWQLFAGGAQFQLTDDHSKSGELSQIRRIKSMIPYPQVIYTNFSLVNFY